MGIREEASEQWDVFRAWATGDATEWAKGMLDASQLPGQHNGPGDAFRHLLLAAELHRIYANNAGQWFLVAHERDPFYVRSDSKMDHYVNRIGAQIGQFVRSQGGDTADVVHLVSQAMENSFPTKSWHSARWIAVPGAGYKMSGAVSTKLPNGKTLPPVVVAVTDPKVWEGTNPEAFPGTRIPTGAANIPDRNWLSRFNYAGSTPTKALKYMLKNRPSGTPNPILSGEHQYP